MAVTRAFSNATVGCSGGGQACVDRVARTVLEAKFRPDICRVVFIIFFNNFNDLCCSVNQMNFFMLGMQQKSRKGCRKFPHAKSR